MIFDIKVCAIVVIYNPNLKLLDEVLDALLKQLNFVIIVDNSDKIHLDATNYLADDRILYISLKRNFGIGYAQNIGIVQARKYGFDFLVLFDQDSVPEAQLITKLLSCHDKLESKRIKVGSVGPRAMSRSNNQLYVAKFNKGSNSILGTTELNQLISSGSLIRLSVFEDVGLFNEDMFIDIVDFEWCWRAHFIHGYRHFISEDARLIHMFGENEKRVLGFRITIPSSFRIYFQFRNYLKLINKGYVPLYWKISNFVKLLVKLFLFPIICENGYTYFKQSLRGIRDGISNRVEEKNV